MLVCRGQMVWSEKGQTRKTAADNSTRGCQGNSFVMYLTRCVRSWRDVTPPYRHVRDTAQKHLLSIALHISGFFLGFFGKLVQLIGIEKDFHVLGLCKYFHVNRLFLDGQTLWLNNELWVTGTLNLQQISHMHATSALLWEDVAIFITSCGPM